MNTGRTFECRKAGQTGLRRLLLFLAAGGLLYGQSSSKEYIRIGGRVVAIENQSIAILTTGPYSALVGSQFNLTLQASGGSGPYTWSVTGLPSWLILNGASLSGTPNSGQIGRYNFTVTATDSTGLLHASQQITVTVGNLGITTASLPGVAVNTAYPSTTLTASGGTGPYTWSAPQGSLPAGLSLSTSGTISGTPTAAGNFSVPITVTDSANSTATKPFFFDVIGVTTQSLTNTSQCPAYSASVSATGGQTPYAWSLTGTPPSGWTINGATGAISGSCPSGGPYTFTVQVTDSATPALIATKQFSVTGALAITGPSSFPNGSVGAAYSTTLTESGGATPVTWSISTGSLPPGLTINSSSGVVSGAPTATGTYNFTVQVKDANNQTASEAFSITVYGLVITTPPQLPTATAGISYSETLPAAGGVPPYTWTMVAGTLPLNMSVSSTGVLSGNPYEATWGTFTYYPQITVRDSGNPQSSASATFTFTVNAPENAGPCVSSSWPSATPGGSSVELWSTNCAAQPMAANWSATSSSGNDYGAGSLSPSTGASTTYYTAPIAVIGDQVADVIATSAGYSTTFFLLLYLPAPAVTVSGTQLTGQTVNVTAGQQFTLSVTASLGDNWTSPNDYVQAYLATSQNTYCQLFYYPATKTLLLANDGNAGLSGGFSSGVLGASGSLSTPSCTVGLNGSATQNPQGYLLTLNLPVTFTSAISGQTGTLAVLEPNGYWTPGSISVGGSGGNPSISVSPTSATLSASQTQQFSATVTNESNTAVTWSISPQTGSISTSGLYTAPSSIATQQTVTVTATSQASSSLTATAQVTLVPASCGTTDLNLSNTTLTSGTQTYSANHNVNALNGFSISGSAVVTFQACNQITLGPGFTAVAGSGGSTFTAVISH